MNPSQMEILAVVAAGMAIVVFPVVRRAYRTYRRTRAVRCPETETLAGVSVDPLRAAVGAAFDRRSLAVTDCTLWPEKRGCDEECVKLIQLHQDAARPGW
jgi:hypothetical protein